MQQGQTTASTNFLMSECKRKIRRRRKSFKYGAGNAYFTKITLFPKIRTLQKIENTCDKKKTVMIYSNNGNAAIR